MHEKKAYLVLQGRYRSGGRLSLCGYRRKLLLVTWSEKLTSEKSGNKSLGTEFGICGMKLFRCDDGKYGHHSILSDKIEVQQT